MSGNLAYGQQEYREAVRCYLKAAETDQQAVVRTLDKMIDAFTKLNDAEGLLAQLQKQWSDSHYIPALTAFIETLATEKNSSDAAVRLLKELESSPSNQGFLTLAELVVTHRQSLDKSQLLQVYDILRRIVAAEPKFVCSNCGFKAKEPHWRCPSCKDWATVKAYVPQPPISK